MEGSAPDRFRDLIAKAKTGDQAAFGLLYEEWYAPLYRFILVRVGGTEIAEDLVQDVFMKIFAHLDRFELRAAHPLGFLYTTARNTIIDYHKKKKPERLDEETAKEIPDDGVRSPEFEASLSSDVVQLGEAMRTLTREQQDIVTLRLIEGRSVREVAEMVGKSEEAVRQMQVRALRSLRGYFSEKGLL
jgi:RNA polymerase sigma-70 factor (ECF subfamily)